MEYDVFQLLKEPVGSTRSFEVADGITIEGDNKYQITGKAEFLRTDRAILVRAHLETLIRCTCSRCLKEFPYTIHINFEEEFFPTIDVKDGTRLTLPEEPNLFTIDNKHILSLREAIREYLLINMPMKPLCSEDCSGLCPVCGKNLNEDSCLCQWESSDSRWSPLLSYSLKNTE